MAFDHFKFRFRAPKWAAFLAAIAVPVITYFVTRKVLDLKTTNVHLWVIAAVYVSAFILYKFNRY